MTRHLIILTVLLAGCGDNLTHPVIPEAYQGAPPAALDCLPNLDGRIDSAEMGAAVGVPVAYLVSPPDATRTVDVVGTVGDGGQRLWDWSGSDGGDQLATLSAGALAGNWYAEFFPQGEFVAPFDAGGRVNGIYSQDERALWLLGLASVEQDPEEGQTLLRYDAPVALFRFPLEPGDSWVSEGLARDSMLRGLPYAGRDTYSVEVSRAGRLALPDLSFSQALQVQTLVEIDPAVGFPTSQRQTSFVFECFGEVARATSAAGETDIDFSDAIEVRRLSLLTGGR